jgi:polyhydroxyalkanoate synthesis regulator phasin
MTFGQNNTIIRLLYEEIISELRTELQAALVDLGHKSAFDLLLKEAWNPEQAAMGNSTLPTVSDKLNIMASIHNRKLIAVLSKELKEKDSEIQELRQAITSLKNKLNELSIQMKQNPC